MGLPTVSVIIPCFNYDAWVGRAVRSALEQDWPAVEVIAVDDGSTDGTPQVLAGFGDRIRVIRRPNGGLNAATSTGMEAATGEFLTFLDADDEWRPDRCRLLAEALIAAPEAGLAYGDMEVIDPAGNTIAPSFRTAFNIEPRTGRVLGTLLANNFISAGSLMVRASLRDRFHPIADVAAWQDWWIASRVAEVADVVSIDAPVNLYRYHGANMNLGQSGEGFANLCRAELPFRRFLLTTVDPALVAPRDLIRGLAAYDNRLTTVSRQDGRQPIEIAPPDAAERALAEDSYREALAALEAREIPSAVALLVRAAALVPGWAEVRILLHDLVPATDGTLEPAPTPRRAVAAVAAEDVLARPEILKTWAQTFGDGDDVTLVVTGLRDQVQVDALVWLAERSGLEAPGAPDVISVEERHPAAVSARLGVPLAAMVDSAAEIAPLAAALRGDLASAAV